MLKLKFQSELCSLWKIWHHQKSGNPELPEGEGRSCSPSGRSPPSRLCSFRLSRGVDRSWWRTRRRGSQSQNTTSLFREKTKNKNWKHFSHQPRLIQLYLTLMTVVLTDLLCHLIRILKFGPSGMLALWLRYAPQWNFIPFSSLNCTHALQPVQFKEEKGMNFHLTSHLAADSWNMMRREIIWLIRNF